MPAAIPDRYKLEMRLGRDGDIEEWLASDTSLDRPVLIRSLGPETMPERRSGFVESVSGAAKTSHPHLARVFAVAQVAGGAYSVSEWTGGSTAEDRVMAHQTVELPDFLPNASGLAGALAALHDHGVVHGAIDLTAISYSVSHPARLGAFGRKPLTDAGGDVSALSAALETALTGSPPGGPPPSERIDGLPRAIDGILRSGQTGALTAKELEKALRAAPTPRVPSPEPRAMSRRLIIAAIALIVVAIGLVALGAVFSGGSAPIIPAPETTAPTGGAEPTTTTETTLVTSVQTERVMTFDPFGGGGENDDEVGNLLDGNLGSAWRTETYEDPLPLLKAGVGAVFTVRGIPSGIELVGFTAGTRFEVYWADVFTTQLDSWERVAGARSPPGTVTVALPGRRDGHWLLWLTDLPGHSDGTFYSAIAEVRFLP